jgi:hypothetical protein
MDYLVQKQILFCFKIRKEIRNDVENAFEAKQNAATTYMCRTWAIKFEKTFLVVKHNIIWFEKALHFCL